MNVLLGLLLLLSLQALILKIFQILWVSSRVLMEIHIKNRFGRPIFFHEFFDSGDSRLPLREIFHLRQNCLNHPPYGVVSCMAVALSARTLCTIPFRLKIHEKRTARPSPSAYQNSWLRWRQSCFRLKHPSKKCRCSLWPVVEPWTFYGFWFPGSSEAVEESPFLPFWSGRARTHLECPLVTGAIFVLTS